MIINIRDDIIQLAKKHWLRHLLIDRTTGGSILWGTDAYMARGEAYERNREIKEALILVDKATVIETRSRKTFEEQNERTKKRAEVFTPRWICTKMNNFLDEEWIAEADFFKSHNWNDFERQITKVKRWKAYVNNRRLEITCGEAPYLVSRYDAHTGEIVAVEDRDGLLDRKLRIISRRVRSRKSWIAWAKKACQSIYGYEFQGDNLLIARINVLKSIEEHFEDKWKEKIPEEELEAFIPIITWNLWQMDGLQDAIPYREDSVREMDLFSFDGTGFSAEKKESPQCLIMDWEQGKAVTFASLKGSDSQMKFDYIIGNPPYQEEGNGEQETYHPPIYHKFMDAVYKISDKVELIHPGRFLFNAGSTPKAWNEKMLRDKHLKVLYYKQNSSEIFKDTDIKGGIAITYHDDTHDYGAINVFTAFRDLNAIISKVKLKTSCFLDSIASGYGVYKLTALALQEHPEIASIQSKGHTKDLKSSTLKKLENIIFFEKRPKNNHNKYVKILGLINKKRIFRWARLDYLHGADSFFKYKVFVPQANGSGALGEVLSTPLIGEPLIGVTETFLSIGSFDTLSEAEACLKYVKSKFARVMLGVLKITQHNPKEKWAYVPLQDFTSSSDIDWSKPIHDIDLQLYKKYGLSDKEIDFIEKHVKEMA